MYNFVDTTERYPGQNLPSEALMFNGSYLENVIPGYRTLYVSGREFWVRRLQIWKQACLTVQSIDESVISQGLLWWDISW